MRSVCVVSVILLSTLACSAQYRILIDDFQQFSAGEIFSEAEDIGWSASSLSDSDEYWIWEDPHDPYNVGLYVYPSFHYQDPDNILAQTVWVNKALPNGGIAPGETGTLIFRYLRTGRDNSLYFGTSDRPTEYDPETGRQAVPGAWEDYNALMKIPTMDVLAHYDGDDFVDTDPVVAVQDNIWYAIYMVIRNTFEEVEGTWASTGTYTLYIMEPGGPEPRLIPVGTDPPKDAASFRRAPLDEDGNPRSIIWCVLSTHGMLPAPSRLDPWIIDDLYFSNGIDLKPFPHVDPSPYYAGYELATPLGDIDTGSWFGWLNVAQAPLIWSYVLDNWLYMEEPEPDAVGSWGYFYK